MMFKVCPSAARAMSAASTDSGIVMAMISVARQLPRNSRIIVAVGTGGDQRLVQHTVDRRQHEH